MASFTIRNNNGPRPQPRAARGTLSLYLKTIDGGVAVLAVNDEGKVARLAQFDNADGALHIRPDNGFLGNGIELDDDGCIEVMYDDLDELAANAAEQAAAQAKLASVNKVKQAVDDLKAALDQVLAGL